MSAVTEEDEGGIVGFDADGKLQSLAWIAHGTTEAEARKFCRKGGLAVKKVSTTEAQLLMIQHGWIKATKRKREALERKVAALAGAPHVG